MTIPIAPYNNIDFAYESHRTEAAKAHFVPNSEVLGNFSYILQAILSILDSNHLINQY